jgi:hypothetical protein
MTAAGTAIFGEAVRLMADALGFELDDVRCQSEYAQTTEHLDLGSWSIAPGCVAGVAVNWQGVAAGRAVVQLKVRWRKGSHLEPDWQIEHGYLVDIQGRPCVKTRFEVYPADDFPATTFGDYMVLGMIMTSVPAVNAIPQVCRARPGSVTYLDLPLVAPGGWVPAH